MKSVPVDWKKVSDAVDSEVMKKAKFNTLKTNLNKIDYKTLNDTTFVHINQCNTDKQFLEKKKWRSWSKIPNVSGLVSTTIFNRKTGKVDTKTTDVSGLVTATSLKKVIAKYQLLVI